MPFRTHLLVVANQTVDSPGLMTALRDRARQGAIRVTLLAPVLWSEREEAPDGRPSQARGTVYVRDVVDRSLVFVCRHDRTAQEVVVVTLWESEGGPAPPRVPRRFTDALRERPPRSAR